MRALSGAQSPLESLVPYQFRTRGVGWLLSQAEPSSPVERLVMARALLDALIYGELSQDGELLDELGRAEVWGQIEGLLSEREGVSDEVAAAKSQGRRLASAMRVRAMDESYHETLLSLSRPGGFWFVEARLAQLLDLDEARQQLGAVPLDARLELWATALAPAVCGGQAASQCELRCESGLSVSGVEVDDVLTVASCGHDALSWPVSAHDRLLSRPMAQVARLMGDAMRDVGELSGGSHPLVVSAQPELVSLQERLSREGVAVSLPVESASDLGPGWRLPQAPGRPSPFEGVASYAALNDEGLRWGLAPLLAGSPSGRLRFLEAEHGFAFPGWPVASAAGLRARVEDARAHVVRVVARSEAVVSEFAPGDRLIGQGGDGAVRVLVDAESSLSVVLSGLDVLRQALGSGRLEVRWCVWDAQRGALAWRPVVLVSGREDRAALESFPVEARPFEPRLRLLSGGLWRLSSQGQVLFEGRGEASLSEAVSSLRTAHPEWSSLPVSASWDHGDVSSLVSVLVSVSSARGGEGGVAVLLVTDL